MQLLEVTAVRGCSRPLETKHGTRIVATVRLPDGTEEKIWGNPGYAPLESIHRGDIVQVGRDAKGKLHLFDDRSEPTRMEVVRAAEAAALPPAPANPTGYSEEQKREMAANVEANAALMVYCLQTANEKFVQSGLVATEDSYRRLATTLFMQAVKCA